MVFGDFDFGSEIGKIFMKTARLLSLLCFCFLLLLLLSCCCCCIVLFHCHQLDLLLLELQ